MTGGLLPLETLTFVLSAQTLRINHVCEAELEKVYGHEREQQQTRRNSWCSSRLCFFQSCRKWGATCVNCGTVLKFELVVARYSTNVSLRSNSGTRK